MADAKLEALAESLSKRIDELVPVACREKSLANTNLEQALLWAEKARGRSHPARRFTLYGDGYQTQDGTPLRELGWLGVIDGVSGPEAMVRTDGEIVSTVRINFHHGQIVSWWDADRQLCHPDGTPMTIPPRSTQEPD